MKIQRIIWNPHGLSGGVGDGEPRYKFSNWAQNLLAPALFPVQTLWHAAASNMSCRDAS